MRNAQSSMISTHYQSFQGVDVLRRVERDGVFKWRVVRGWYMGITHITPYRRCLLAPSQDTLN
jgi:hypothetical protein